MSLEIRSLNLDGVFGLIIECFDEEVVERHRVGLARLPDDAVEARRDQPLLERLQDCMRELARLVPPLAAQRVVQFRRSAVDEIAAQLVGTRRFIAADRARARR